MPIYPKCYAKFKKSSLEKMKELIEASQEVEHSAMLCMEKETKKINLRNVCRGWDCGVEIKKGCAKGEIEFGEFHTHPETPIPGQLPNDIPSSMDWFHWIENDYHLPCLGTKNVINCYQPKFDPVTKGIEDYTPEELGRIDKIEHIANKMSMCEDFIANHPDPQDKKREPALKNLMKYTKDLEEYYHRFAPEECVE